MEFPIRYDCRHYNGYKPCGLGQCAADCPHFEARGKRILILKLAAMGDVLRSTPLLHGLREAYDPCTITWLTDPAARPLLEGNPLIDRVLVWGHDATVLLTGEGFDLTLNLEKEPRALALDALLRAPDKRGFALHPEHGSLCVHNAASEYALRLGLDDDLKFHGNRKTMPEILYEMAELPWRRQPYVLPVQEKSRRFARDFARLHGIDPERPLVGINTGCGSIFPSKQWPQTHFAELIALIGERSDWQMLLLGGEREKEINATLLGLDASGRLIDGGANNPLEDFIALIELCDAVVSADSLAMHLGIGLGKHTIALMGPTSQSEIELYDRGHILVSDRDCLPCYCKVCPQPVSCMHDLPPHRVFEALEAWDAARKP